MAGRRPPGIAHRSFAVDAEGACHRGEVDGRVIYVGADAGVFHRAIAKLGDLDAMLF